MSKGDQDAGFYISLEDVVGVEGTCFMLLRI